MERGLKFLFLSLVLATGAVAEVGFRSPDKYNPWEEPYSRSQWGQAPAQVDLRSSIPAPGRSLASTPAGVTPSEDPYRPQTVMRTEQPVSPAGADLVPDRHKGIQEVSVIVSDLGYFPRTFFVTRNVPVRLYVTGASRQSLCFMMEPFNVMRQVRTNDVTEIVFTPNSSGQYRFHCPVNNLEGTMVVRELASSSGPTSEPVAQQP